MATIPDCSTDQTFQTEKWKISNINCFANYVSIHFTRFNERVFIPHFKTRKLLHQFTSKGTSQEEFAELCHLITVQGKALVPLFNHLKLQLDSSKSNIIVCPQPLSELIRALSASSPVCALVHPSNVLFDLLTRLIKKDDLTKDFAGLKLLQERFPLLARCLKALPNAVLAPVLEEMIRIVEVTYLNDDDVPTESLGCDEPNCSELAYFPTLLKVRHRGSYVADKIKALPLKNCVRNLPKATQLYLLEYLHFIVNMVSVIIFNIV